MLIFDPEFPNDRWRVNGVARDGRIEAKRINPADGIQTSWSADSWARAWAKGYLVEARR